MMRHMNQVDAYKLLASELAVYREMRFEELVQFVVPQSCAASVAMTAQSMPFI